MSSYIGKSERNKSKKRQDTKKKIELTKKILAQEGNPLKELSNLFKGGTDLLPHLEVQVGEEIKHELEKNNNQIIKYKDNN